VTGFEKPAQRLQAESPVLRMSILQKEAEAMQAMLRMKKLGIAELERAAHS
jgi:hypothetical protein